MSLCSKLIKRISMFLLSLSAVSSAAMKWSLSVWEDLLSAEVTHSSRTRPSVFHLSPGQGPSLRLRFILRCRMLTGDRLVEQVLKLFVVSTHRIQKCWQSGWFVCGGSPKVFSEHMAYLHTLSNRYRSQSLQSSVFQFLDTSWLCLGLPTTQHLPLFCQEWYQARCLRGASCRDLFKGNKQFCKKRSALNQSPDFYLVRDVSVGIKNLKVAWVTRT